MYFVWVLVYCFPLGVTLVGILLSSGFLWEVIGINPVGGSVSYWVPWRIAYLISYAWRDGFFLSLIFWEISPNCSWLIWGLAETLGGGEWISRGLGFWKGLSSKSRDPVWLICPMVGGLGIEGGLY